MEQLTVLLDLTPAQQQKVRVILAAEHARMMQSVRQAMRQVRDTHRAVRKDTIEKLSGVLSPEQLRKFKVLLPGPHRVMGAMMMHGMMMRGRDRGPPSPPGAGPGPGPN